MVKWAQIHNGGPAAIAGRGLSCTLHFREKPQTKLPATSTRVLPSEMTLRKDFLLLCILTNRLRAVPSNWSRAAASLFASLLTNQRCSITTNQNAQFEPIRTVLFESIKLCKIGFLLYIKMDQSETRAGTFLRGVHFRFVYLIKVSPFSIPQIGDPVVIGLVAAIFC